MVSELFASDLYPVFLFILILFIIFRIYWLLWVAKDISWRTNSTHFQVLCICLIALTTPLIWLPLYFLLRPIQRYDRYNKKYTSGKHYNEILCKECWHANDNSFEYCAFCGDKIVVDCSGCAEKIPLGYYYCPFCWKENSLKNNWEGISWKSNKWVGNR